MPLLHVARVILHIDHLSIKLLVFVYIDAKITNRNIVLSKLQVPKMASSFLRDNNCYYKISENDNQGVF